VPLFRNLNYNSGGGDVKVEEAAKAAAEYNKMLNRERRDLRGAYFDIQTFAVHYPRTGNSNEHDAFIQIFLCRLA
jgi:hypothetical protein